MASRYNYFQHVCKRKYKLYFIVFFLQNKIKEGIFDIKVNIKMKFFIRYSIFLLDILYCMICKHFTDKYNA